MIAEHSRAIWRKSSYSGSGNNCVELTRLTEVVAIRDSKHLQDSPIALRPERWAEFSEQVKAGIFDR